MTAETTPPPTPTPRRRCRACGNPTGAPELAAHQGCCAGCWANLISPTAGPADSYDQALAEAAH